MTTKRKNYGPFRVVVRHTAIWTRFGLWFAYCEQQISDENRSRLNWWIKKPGTPCYAGPWSADALRKHYGTEQTPEALTSKLRALRAIAFDVSVGPEIEATKAALSPHWAKQESARRANATHWCYAAE